MQASAISVRAKMLMCFGLVLAVTLAMGGFAVNRLAQVNA
jgi:hypothetical protein